MPRPHRNALPRWAVLVDGVKLGEIQEKHLSGARLPFYEAIVPHPRTGKPVSLELHTDREERVAAIIRFHSDPDTFRQHWS